MKTLVVRRSKERGHANHGWLNSYHTFSFANYHDRNFMGFKALRVINDDKILSQTGFEMHSHENMEIITYMLSGTLTHSDNLGNKEEIKEGELQIMSAGSGITHSEWNFSSKESHFLQIWIKPSKRGAEPYYKIYSSPHFEVWCLVASENGDENSVKIRQNAAVYVLNSGELTEIELPQSNKTSLWLHLAEGNIVVNDIELNSGDALALQIEPVVTSSGNKIQFLKQSKVLLFFLE